MNHPFKQYKENKTHGTPLYPFIVYEIKRTSSPVIIPLHWHHEMEIILIKSGTLHININNQQYLAKAGDIFIINKENLHEMYVYDSPIHYYALVFSIEQFSFMQSDFTQTQYLDPIMYKNISFTNVIDTQTPLYTKLKKQINHIIKLNKNCDKAYQLGTKAALLEVFYLLINANAYTSSKDHPVGNKEAKLKLQKDIIDYINDHYKSSLSLSEISRVFNMSPKYFCRYFKSNFNRTFIEYINYLRIEKATELLANTTLSISDISSSLGFDNFSYFSRKFKEIIGTTPREYKKHENR